MARLQQAAAARLHRHRQQQAAAAAATRRAAAPAVPSAPERYDLNLINMLCEYMSSCYLSMFIMMLYASSMFNLYVVVMFYVISNILELIIKIMPNYPTPYKPKKTEINTLWCVN